MGTCCDWQSSIMSAFLFAPNVPGLDLLQLATDWRAGFFDEIHARFSRGEGPEDIDVTHRRVLDRLLEANGVNLQTWDNSLRKDLVAQWHVQRAWPDVIPALNRLRRHYFVVVLANGTTRLQLDILKSSGIPFHSAFSSQLLGHSKPDPAIYLKALELMQLKPENCAMVAAHAYDLRAAKKVGMRTIYICRTTEDLDENMQLIEDEVDMFFDGRSGDIASGLSMLVLGPEGHAIIDELSR
ncbi:haloacid dehalogenase [Rhizodiscina lignyota]|uniref:Haloacid dehalogenase n=1 Tax=Rhizodiscina lignyota TaxID=1504668 RepID=A0A9P4M1H4_9PEZI|nr:haloacid dehalogenase [Rhizodiscina lignyota]